MCTDIDEFYELISPIGEFCEDDTKVTSHVNTPVSEIVTRERMIAKYQIEWISPKEFDRSLRLRLDIDIIFLIVLLETLSIEYFHRLCIKRGKK